MQGKIVLTAECLAITAFAVILRTASLDQPPGDNEIFHILAARSWMEKGTLDVGQGAYTRNADFTILLSWLFRAIGDSGHAVARLPSVLAGTLLVLAVFLWMRPIAGRAGAWIAAILMACSPLAIGMSQFVRIYALQGLTFWLAATSVFMIVSQPGTKTRRLLLGSIAVVLFAFSINLRIISAIGLAGVLLWLAVEMGPSVLARAATDVRTRWSLIVGAAIASAALIYLWSAGVVGRLIALYGDIQPQSAYKLELPLYYHKLFLEDYPALWSLLPVAILVAFVRNKRFALFCAIILITALLVHSFAARKAARYIAYVLPFFYALWGLVLAALIPHAKTLLQSVIESLRPAHGPMPGEVIGKVLVGLVVVGFLAATNSVMVPIYRSFAAADYSGPDWPAAEDVLRPWLGADAVVIVSPMQAPIYYYGRADMEFGDKYVYESALKKEFAVDERTGLVVFSTEDSMRRVIQCFARGVLIMDARRWRQTGYGPTDDVLAVLDAEARELPVRRWGLRAYAWERPAAASDGKCDFRASVAKRREDRSVHPKQSNFDIRVAPHA